MILSKIAEIDYPSMNEIGHEDFITCRILAQNSSIQVLGNAK